MELQLLFHCMHADKQHKVLTLNKYSRYYLANTHTRPSPSLHRCELNTGCPFFLLVVTTILGIVVATLQGNGETDTDRERTCLIYDR